MQEMCRIPLALETDTILWKLFILQLITEAYLPLGSI